MLLLNRADIPTDGQARRAERPANAVENRVEADVVAAAPNPAAAGQVQEPEQENEVHAPQQRENVAGVTNAEPSTSISTMATKLSSNLQSKEKSSSSGSFPQFYVVVSKDDLPIVKLPSSSSTIIRTIKIVS